MPITQNSFGKTQPGDPILLYTLTNDAGLEARIMNYGGTLVSLKTPDRHGKLADIVLGFDDCTCYLKEHPYFGTLIGRYANRIANGEFELNGKIYHLAKNNGPHHLHGGLRGFDKVLWQSQAATTEKGETLKLFYSSPDGEEGYPGQLDVSVTYTLTQDNQLRLEESATTSAPTWVNLTQHAYFNLLGSGSILNHVLMIAADEFLPTDATLIPTGERRLVKGTPMDFTCPTPIGTHLHDRDQQLISAHGGYDHNWILKKQNQTLDLAASVFEPESGRTLKVLTTKPGLQFYSGNFLDGSLCGKGGQNYQKHSGFCLEPQYFPDSPHRPDFPNAILLPTQTYRHTTVYQFGAS